MLAKFRDFFATSLLRYWVSPLHPKISGVCCNQRILVDKSGMIRTQMEIHNRSENGCSACDALYDIILQE
jgi:hypothetical protein